LNRPLRVAFRKSDPNIPGMPKPDRLWTCSVCAQVVVNEPQPVLSHQLTHVRRPYAKAQLPRPEAERHEDRDTTD
jgi:hypothetical protein